MKHFSLTLLSGIGFFCSVKVDAQHHIQYANKSYEITPNGISTTLSENEQDSLSVSFGNKALQFNTQQGNVGLGFYSLRNNASVIDPLQGLNNLGIGAHLLFKNSEGNSNLAIGSSALQSSNGSGNLGIGWKAGQNFSTNKNIAIGSLSLMDNADSVNLAIGQNALFKNRGRQNIALGDSAQLLNLHGSENIAIGHKAMMGGSLNQSPQQNIAIGTSTFRNVENLQKSIAIGQYAGMKFRNGSNVIAIGDSALYNKTTGTNIVAIGVKTVPGGGDGTVAIGHQILKSNITGVGNTGIGHQTLNHNTFGNRNIAIGDSALYENTYGNNSVAIGFRSLSNYKKSGFEIAIGYEALKNHQGFDLLDGNVTVGFRSLNKAGTPRHSTFVGSVAAENANYSINNTGIGYNVLSRNLTGRYIVAIGSNVMSNNQDGDQNVVIGESVGGYMKYGRYNTLINSYYINEDTTNVNYFRNTIVDMQVSEKNLQDFIGLNGGFAGYDQSILIGRRKSTFSSTSQTQNYIRIGVSSDAPLFSNFIHSGKDAVFIKKYGQGITVDSLITVINSRSYGGYLKDSSVTHIGNVGLLENNDNLVFIGNVKESASASTNGFKGFNFQNAQNSIVVVPFINHENHTSHVNNSIYIQNKFNPIAPLPPYGFYDNILDIRTDSIRLYSSASTLTLSKTRFDPNVNVYRFDYYPLIKGSYNNNALAINHNGSMSHNFLVNGDASKTTTGNWVSWSDRRLKKSIQTIPTSSALQKVLSMKGVSYEWDDNRTGIERPSGLMYGFIAQDLEEVFPEKVQEDSQGYKFTAYGEYDAMIVESIKALNRRISQLKKMNKEIEDLNKQLAQILDKNNVTK